LIDVGESSEITYQTGPGPSNGEGGNMTDASLNAVAIGITTEFFGESCLALRKVLAEENGVLTVSERDVLRSVIDQLDAVLKQQG
jgi:hypothetical protein